QRSESDAIFGYLQERRFSWEDFAFGVYAPVDEESRPEFQDHRRFPCITKIRLPRKELDDLIHDLFAARQSHCSLLPLDTISSSNSNAIFLNHHDYTVQYGKTVRLMRLLTRNSRILMPLTEKPYGTLNATERERSADNTVCRKRKEQPTIDIIDTSTQERRIVKRKQEETEGNYGRENNHNKSAAGGDCPPYL
ncbi:unnamed protein product, partial [Didymodactylos carnosus]